jgi:carboxymethylenebutenolidase
VVFVAGVVLVDIHGAAAQDSPEQALEDSPRHHEWVMLETADGRQVRAYIVFPEVDHAATSVVVIHENRGLNPWARSVADKLAAEGYVAIAPDMIHGLGPDGGGTDSFESSDAAREAIYALTDEQVVSALDAAVAYVRGLDSTTDTVAVAGFCWGGGQSFKYATHSADIAAAFVFYGSAVTDPQALARIEAPVYGFYGGNDNRITAAVPEVGRLMAEAGKNFESVVYEGAGHGFMRSGEPADADPANKAAAIQGWERWKQLLAELGSRE